MPTMQLSIPSQNIHVSKNFPSPVKITQVWKGWYKTCKNLCKDVPDVPELVGWETARWASVHEPEVDEKWIKFKLQHRYTGETAHLVINRKGPSM